VALSSASKELRDALRARMFKRIEELGLSSKDAAEAMGFDRQQMWRLKAGEDVYSFDRLVEAAVGLGLEIRVKAVRRACPKFCV
jgi:transcriptional regulator with XRE-family HTH domain